MSPETREDEEQFYTWVLVGNPAEASLRNTINIDEAPPLPQARDTEHRFELSIADPRPVLRASKTAQAWLFQEAKDDKWKSARTGQWGNPGEFLLFSSAPRRDIEQLWRKKCVYNNSYYVFLPVEFPYRCPYQHRLLALRYTGNAIPYDAKPLGIDIPSDGDKVDVVPNLWPHVRRHALSLNQARNFFSRDSRDVDVVGKGGVNAVRGSLFLPPVRQTVACNYPDIYDRLRHDLSYFSSERTALRVALLKNSSAIITEPEELQCPNTFSLPVRADAPLNIQALHVMDEPLVRDILLDGGRISIQGKEGAPTRLSVEFVGGDDFPVEYRRRFFQESPEDPGWPLGPTQFFRVIRALQDDLTHVVQVPTHLSALDSRVNPSRWDCKESGRYVDPQYEASGTCDKIGELGPDLFEDQSKVLKLLVTDPAGKSGTRAGADNHLAELLFMTHVWRYPSGENVIESDVEAPEKLGWRMALVELLINSELKRGVGITGTAERVALWNSKKPGTHPFSWTDAQRELIIWAEETAYDLWKRRFLLPLGSTILAKTMILDHIARSSLDSDFVLA